jgi:PAS domain S-box-containing protein
MYDNKIITCNNETLKILEVNNIETILNSKPSDISPKHQPDGELSKTKSLEMIDLAYKNSYHRFEWEHKSFKGEILPIEVSLTPIEIDNKQMLYVVWRDITLRKETEKTLKQSEEDYKNRYDHFPFPSFIWQKQGDDFVMINANQTAYEESDGNIENYFNIKSKIFWKNEPELSEYLKQCYNTKQTINIEKKYFFRGIGKEKFISATFSFLPPKSVQIIAVDITEQKLAELRITESEKKYKALSNFAFEGIIIIKNNKVIDLNKTFEKISGYKYNELIGKNAIKLFVKEKYQTTVYKTLKHRNFAPIIIEAINKNGNILNLEVEIKTINTNSDLENISILSIRDLTETRKSQLLINKLSTAVNQTPASIVITNINGDIEYVNPKFEEITGYTIKEAIGKNPRILKTNHFPTKYYQKLWSDISTGKTWRGEFYNKRKDGSHFWEESIISPVFDETNKIINYIAIKVDITERKKIQSELKGTNNKLKLQNVEIYLQNKLLKDSNKNLKSITAQFNNIVTSSNAIIIELDSKYKIIRWNNTIVELTGIISSKIIGKPFYEANLPKGINDAINHVIESNIENKKIKDYETNIISIKKNILTILFSFNSKFNRQGEISNILIVGQDITELTNYKNFLELRVKERTKKLKKALEKEKELNKLKTDFVSVVSHEFRTPLSAIKFSANFINNYFDKLDTEKIKLKLENIDTQVKHMTGLLEDVLILGKTKSNKINFNPKIIISKDYFNKIIEEIYISTNQTHNIIYSENVKNGELFIDETLGRNIFINLLNNAIKFSPNADKVEIIVEFLSSKTKISIIDYGIGISDKVGILAPFVRGENAKNIQGTGLGLSIVHESIKKHKGKIKIKTEINKGSIFEILLPLKK